MERIYTFYVKAPRAGLPDQRLDNTTRFEEIKLEQVTAPYYVIVNSMYPEDDYAYRIDSVERLEDYRLGLERTAAWRPDLKESIAQVRTSASALGDTITQWNDTFGGNRVDTTLRDVPTPVKGDHYQNYIEELQWIDAMSRIPKYRDPALFKAAVELQVRKYLDRLGRKDEELQELLKALWYMKYLCAYVKAGNVPIKGKDVDDILSGKLGRVSL
jgi:hypothetical protein